jgi:hypothetical protein
MANLQLKKRSFFPGRTTMHRKYQPAAWPQKNREDIFLENCFIFFLYAIVEISPVAHSKLRTEKKSPKRSMQTSSHVEKPCSSS